MIVVTGPGRSGTSLLAALYRELGFDPGGVWNPAVRAGYEAADVVAANVAIARDLDIAGPGREPPRFLPDRVRGRVRAWTRNVPGFSTGRLRLARWDRLPEVLRRHGGTLRRIANQRAVAKDPRFCLTLGVWAAAGASIDHVLICTRSLGAIAASRAAARHQSARAAGPSRNAAAYALGMAIAAVTEHRLPYSVVRFPDFLEHPELLFDAARFPTPVGRDRFLEAFRAIADPSLVHHRD